MCIRELIGEFLFDGKKVNISVYMVLQLDLVLWLSITSTVVKMWLLCILGNLT